MKEKLFQLALNAAISLLQRWFEKAKNESAEKHQVTKALEALQNAKDIRNGKYSDDELNDWLSPSRPTDGRE